MNFLIPRIQSWWLLWLATVITMAIVAASQLFTDRISLLLDRQATELLAADLLIRSNDPIEPTLRELAENNDLRTAETVQLRTAIFINDEPQLVELKAVSPEYPLRGELETKTDLIAEAVKVGQGPAPGELWIDSKLAGQLGTSLELGYLTSPTTQLLHFEPDRGGSLFNLAPRVMMNLADLDATGLIMPGSRARYFLLVAGTESQVALFEAAVKPMLKEGQRLQNVTNARPEMRTALQRTSRFFSLSIVMTLVIAMVAIAITARYAASKEATKVAVMRTYGISSRRLLRYYLSQVLRVWLLALPFGLLLGLAAQYPLQWSLGYWFGARLPDPTIVPFILASIVGLVSLVGFSLPPLITVIETPPMQVFRPIKQLVTRGRSLLLIAISLATLFAVLLLVVSEIKIAIALFIAVLGAAGAIPLFLKLILFAVRRVGQRNFWLKNYVLSRLLSVNRNALFVMSGFSLTLLSVLLISIVKDQLLDDWERQMPADQPNYFLVNIPTDEVDALTEVLEKFQVPTSGAYPLIRARMASINDVPVGELKHEVERAKWLTRRTFNISFSEQLPVDNEIVEGEWLSASEEANQFSIEEDVAKDLNLEIGDKLEFTLAGSNFHGRVSSIRSVVWENFRPNFFVMGTREQLTQQPQTWLLSAVINDQNRTVLKTLVERFPTVTLLDIGEIMTRIKGIVDRASLALEFFFIFAIIAANIVLLSALNTANQDRKMEIALLQALGGQRTHKLSSQVFEFVLMGLLVGFFAALFASLTGYLVADLFFDIKYSLSLDIWLFSIGSAVGLITIIGTLFIARSFSTSPMRLLRS